LGNLKSFLVGINNFEVEVIEGKSVKNKAQIFDNRTFSISIIFIRASVSECEDYSGQISVGISHFII